MSLPPGDARQTRHLYEALEPDDFMIARKPQQARRGCCSALRQLLASTLGALDRLRASLLDVRAGKNTISFSNAFRPPISFLYFRRRLIRRPA